MGIEDFQQGSLVGFVFKVFLSHPLSPLIIFFNAFSIQFRHFFR